MLVLWTASVLVLTVRCQEVAELEEDAPSNITALFPVQTADLNQVTTPQPSTQDHLQNTITGTTTWKIDTAFVQPFDKEPNNKTIIDANNKSLEFRPSPLLENFFDLDSVEEPSKNVIFHAPAVQFKSTSDIRHHSTFRFPYDFELPAVRSAASLQHRPQALGAPLPPAPAPATTDVRAGVPHPGFDAEPSSDLKHLTRQRDREVSWRRMTRLLTALLPVGLLVSALTPGVLTISSERQYERQRRIRRSDSFALAFFGPSSAAADLTAQNPPPTLGEPCRSPLPAATRIHRKPTRTKFVARELGLPPPPPPPPPPLGVGDE